MLVCTPYVLHFSERKPEISWEILGEQYGVRRTKIACKCTQSEAGDKNNKLMWEYLCHFLELCLLSHFIFLLQAGFYHFTGQRTMRHKCWYTGWQMYMCCLSATNLINTLEKWSLAFRRGDFTGIKRTRVTQKPEFSGLSYCFVVHIILRAQTDDSYWVLELEPLLLDLFLKQAFGSHREKWRVSEKCHLGFTPLRKALRRVNIE